MSLPDSNTALPDAAAQVQRAKGLYKWLWLSPLLTLPTLGFLLVQGFSLANRSYGGYANYPSSEEVQRAEMTVVIVAVLGSGLWHLVLLSRALDRQHEFVRWHGRQALLLAGVRTAVALWIAVGAASSFGGSSPIWGVLILILVWLIGTLWGQGQAAAGHCSLMRWAGHGAVLPLRVAAGQLVTQDQMDRASSLQKHGGAADAALVFRQVLVSGASPTMKAQAAEYLLAPGQAAGGETADVLVAILRYSLDPGRRHAALDALEQAGLVETL